MLRYLVDPIFQVINTAGKPATGGWLEVYIHGTRTKYYCASDFNGTLHPFKIPLDSLGSNIVLADDGQAYDVYAYNRYGSQLMSRYNVKPGSGSGSEPVVIDDRPISRIEVGSNTLDGPDWVGNSWKYSLYSIKGDKLAWRQVGGDLNYGNVYAQAGAYHYDFVVNVDWHGEPRNEVQRFQIIGINPVDRDTWISFDLSYQHSEFYHFGSIATRVEGYEDRVFSTIQISPYNEAPAGLTATVQTLTIYSLDDAKTIVTEGPAGIDRVYHDKTMNGDGTFVNPLSVTSLGKTHLLKAVSDDLADVSAPYSFWILDLEKPNAGSPYGYDYAMASEIIAKLSAGEIFVLSTYSTAPSSNEDLFTMCVARDQSREGHAAVRIDFTRMYAGSPEYMYYTAIYTPSMYNGSSGSTEPEERMAIFNPLGQQAPLCSFEFMPYTNLADVATTGNYNDLSNKPNLTLKEDVSNKSQTLDATSTTEYPSSKAAADFVNSSIADNQTTTVRQNGQADNSKCPTEAAVRTAIDSAVSSAYHAAGTKTVAQLTSSLLVSANEGDVYNITDFGSTTSDFIEGAGLPIRVGDNVVVCNVGGGVYKFDLLSGFVDLTNYLTKTGDGSDVTASFTAASTRTNVTTGEKLSVLFGKIAKWFSDLKSLAFKDKVDTADIDNDAVTADKVKDNETLPVNISGYASHLRQARCRFGADATGYKLMAYLPPESGYSDAVYVFNIYETRDAAILDKGVLKGTLSICIRNNNGSYQYSSLYTGYSLSDIGLELRVDESLHGVRLYAAKSNQYYCTAIYELLNAYQLNGVQMNPTLYVNSTLQESITGTSITPTVTLLKHSGGTIPLANNSGVGSATEPVYVSDTGEVLPCTPVNNQIYNNTVNVNQVDNNTETSSFTFVNGHVYHLTLQLEGSPLLIPSTSSGTGYVVAYIGSSMSQSHYSCRQLVDIQSGDLTIKDIKLPVNWKAENITGSSDNQLHVVVVFNSTSYGFSTTSPYQLILQGTDFIGT